MSTHRDGCEDGIIPTLLSLDEPVKQSNERCRFSFHINNTYEFDLLGIDFCNLCHLDGIHFGGSSGC